MPNRYRSKFENKSQKSDIVRQPGSRHDKFVQTVCVKQPGLARPRPT